MKRVALFIIGASALIFAAVTVWLTEPPEVIICLAAATLAHEAGHACAMLICGAAPRLLRPQPFGFRLDTAGRLCGYGAEAFIYLAGAAANLLCAAVTLPFMRFAQNDGLFCFFLFSAGLAVFNLLPLPHSDGAGALSALLSLALRSHCTAYRVCRAVTFAFSAVFWGVSLLLLLNGRGGVYPFLMSVWMLAEACGQQWER